MMVTLIPISYLLVFLLFYCGLRRTAREAVVIAFLALGLAITISTEVASALHAVNPTALGLAWAALTCTLAIALGRTIRQGLTCQVWARLRQWRPLARADLVLLALTGALMALTLGMAIISPPNTWDSMSYHMARVAQWISHNSVDFYATAIPRQNFLAPAAEYHILHLQVLNGSDRLANLVQWWSYGMAIVLTTLIVQELGQPVRIQLLAALLAATVPMAILQASSTQNDLVVAAYSLAFAYFLLRLVRTTSWRDALLAGVALGLALLTKGTAYVYCAAIGLAIGAGSLLLPARRQATWHFLGRLAVVAIIGLLLSAGHFWRNYRLYGNVLGGASSGYLNAGLSAEIVLSNVLRNMALHLDTPSGRVNADILRGLQAVLGEGINDPRSTYRDTRFFVARVIHEDISGNLVHMLLICLAFALLPVSRSRHNALVYLYALAVLLAILIYASLLRWQPWATRLHTPVFMLAAPLIAIVLMNLGKATRILVPITVFVVTAYAVPYLVSNQARSLAPRDGVSILTTPRQQLYFANRRALYPNYLAAIDQVKQQGVDEVGLLLGEDDWEYPLWTLAGSAAGGTPSFRHVAVTNQSATLAPDEILPTFILATVPIDESRLAGVAYDTVLEGDYVNVLRLRPVSP